VIGAETAPGAVDPAEFLPRGPVPPEASMAGIRALVGTMRDRWLRALLESFLDDPGFAAEFAAAPAGKRNHHAYVGGLAEHTHSIMELCALVVGHYPGVDRDLLLAGAFCHDIGKTRELAVQPGFPYTEEGELLGHIPLGFAMVRERAATLPGFPADRLTDLGHLVLSHQGELEWGSPVQPRTLEAIVLHFLDNLDSKVATARHHLAGVESGRTGWIRPLGRTLFRRGPAEEAPPPPPASPGGGPDAPPAGGDAGGAPSLFDELD
jgi:3'-5' exoribonuclease